MSFKDFLKDKVILITLVFLGIISIEIFLIPFDFGGFIKLYIPIVLVIMFSLGLVAEFLLKRNFYNNFIDTLDELDTKYLVSELVKPPDFIEGKILKNTLDEVDKSMIENVNKYKYIQEDYKEYIELWIHEIKIPIAASKMIIENNKNEVTKSIDEELDKVEKYIEQALYYARSHTVEKDYYIKKVVLKDIVNECIKKDKNTLIQEKISLNLHDLELEVNTDSKWIVFILSQIIQNSVKYRKTDTNLGLEIFAKQGPQNVILYIKDNGIGIKKGEITRVFEKGFTGTNGRATNKKSTGIGLYICKNLCAKLGISIELNSKFEEGTEVRLVFPKGSYLNV